MQVYDLHPLRHVAGLWSHQIYWRLTSHSTLTNEVWLCREAYVPTSPWSSVSGGDREKRQGNSFPFYQPWVRASYSLSLLKGSNNQNQKTVGIWGMCGSWHPDMVGSCTSFSLDRVQVIAQLSASTITQCTCDYSGIGCCVSLAFCLLFTRYLDT